MRWIIPLKPGAMMFTGTGGTTDITGHTMAVAKVLITGFLVLLSGAFASPAWSGPDHSVSNSTRLMTTAAAMASVRPEKSNASTGVCPAQHQTPHIPPANIRVNDTSRLNKKRPNHHPASIKRSSGNKQSGNKQPGNKQSGNKQSGNKKMASHRQTITVVPVNDPPPASAQAKSRSKSRPPARPRGQNQQVSHGPVNWKDQAREKRFVEAQANRVEKQHKSRTSRGMKSPFSNPGETLTNRLAQARQGKHRSSSGASSAAPGGPGRKASRKPDLNLEHELAQESLEQTLESAQEQELDLELEQLSLGETPENPPHQAGDSSPDDARLLSGDPSQEAPAQEDTHQPAATDQTTSDSLALSLVQTVGNTAVTALSALPDQAASALLPLLSALARSGLSPSGMVKLVGLLGLSQLSGVGAQMASITVAPQSRTVTFGDPPVVLTCNGVGTTLAWDLILPSSSSPVAPDHPNAVNKGIIIVRLPSNGMVFSNLTVPTNTGLDGLQVRCGIVSTDAPPVISNYATLTILPGLTAVENIEFSVFFEELSWNPVTAHGLNGNITYNILLEDISNNQNQIVLNSTGNPCCSRSFKDLTLSRCHDYKATVTAQLESYTNQDRSAQDRSPGEFLIFKSAGLDTTSNTTTDYIQVQLKSLAVPCNQQSLEIIYSSGGGDGDRTTIEMVENGIDLSLPSDQLIRNLQIPTHTKQSGYRVTFILRDEFNAIQWMKIRIVGTLPAPTTADIPTPVTDPITDIPAASITQRMKLITITPGENGAPTTITRRLITVTAPLASLIPTGTTDSDGAGVSIGLGVSAGVVIMIASSVGIPVAIYLLVKKRNKNKTPAHENPAEAGLPDPEEDGDNAYELHPVSLSQPSDPEQSAELQLTGDQPVDLQKITDLISQDALKDQAMPYTP